MNCRETYLAGSRSCHKHRVRMAPFGVFSEQGHFLQFFKCKGVTCYKSIISHYSEKSMKNLTEGRKMSVGQRLKEWRLKNNLKTTEIKEKTGISTGGFSDYENDRKLVGSKTLITLSEYYDIDIQYILTGVRNITDLSQQDKVMIEAYHSADPGTRSCVNKLLDIEPDQGKSSDYRLGKIV